jgi:hypothetical protein
MNILTYNLCLKPVVFEITKDYLNDNFSLVYSIDFSNTKKYYNRFFKNNIFCDQKNSKKGLDYDKSKFHFYLDKKILTELSNLELQAYRLMSRYEKNDNLFNFNSRKKHYFDLLKFAFGLIKKYKIKKIIFFDYPHHMESYVLYEVAKYLHIDVTIISYLFIGEYRLVVDKNINDRFEDFLSKKKYDNFKKENLNYFIKLKNQNNYMKPSYVVENSNYIYLFYYFLKDLYRSYLSGFLKESNNFVKTNLYEKFQNIKFPSEVASSFLMLFNRLKILKLKKTYKRIISKNIDFTKNYILFCPNLQPEASTMPMAGVYSDFELIIDTLLAELPNDWSIYYKEHPLVFNLLKESYFIKNKFYYKHISNPKIKFIDYKEDIYKLIDNSKFVVTPTGSVGLEAMIRDKKVAFFGITWWKNFSDPSYIEGPLDIKKIIKENFNKKVNQNTKIKDDYIKTFEQSLPWIALNYDNYEEFIKDYNEKKIDKNILYKIKSLILSKIENKKI